MLTGAVYLATLFGLGLVAMALRLPPLVGFLTAGFVLNGAGVPQLPYVDELADLGVTLLLFSIGLKLDVRFLLRREVWATAVAHMAIVIPVAVGFLGGLGLLGVGLLRDEGVETLLLLSFALSFSSTVFVIKVLDERSESQSLYGRIAIGILVLQDLAAVGFLAFTAESEVSPWAPLLLLLLPLSRPVRHLWSRLGHGEMQAVFGIFMALVPGYALFSLVNLKGDLGALIMGVLLAGHPAASELSRTLLSLKDLLLVAFFVNIGYSGDLTWQSVGLGLALVTLVPVQAGAYVVLLRWARLRRRTATLTGLALANHSEFGLIVVAIGLSSGRLESGWLTAMAVAVAVSFVLSSVVNGLAPTLVPRITDRMRVLDNDELHPEDRYVDLTGAHALVLGMGRVGTAAYRRLTGGHDMSAIGVELSPARVGALRSRGIEVIEADASDNEFWERVAAAHTIEVAVLAMPFHGSNELALTQLHRVGFTGRVVAIAQYDDDARSLEGRGVDAVLQIYDGAGAELADRAVRRDDPTHPAETE